MKRLLNSFSQLLLVLVLGVSLSGCVTTHVPTASTSPWQAMDLDTCLLYTSDAADEL